MLNNLLKVIWQSSKEQIMIQMCWITESMLILLYKDSNSIINIQY